MGDLTKKEVEEIVGEAVDDMHRMMQDSISAMRLARRELGILQEENSKLKCILLEVKEIVSRPKITNEERVSLISEMFKPDSKPHLNG